jgi:hypothetical protein
MDFGPMPVIIDLTGPMFHYENADGKSRLHTDGSNLCPAMGAEFVKYESVNLS